MPRVVVVDSWALLALVRGETQAAVAVKRWLRRGQSGSTKLLLNVINLGEVYWSTIAFCGSPVASGRRTRSA